MDDPNITMEEYIRLEEEKDRRHGRTFNWQTTTFEKVKNYEDEDDCSIDFKTKFLAIVFDNTLITILSDPMVCPPNKNKVDFIISLDESDDEDYTVIFDENSFSYKIIFVNDLKTDSKNDKNHMPTSPNPTVDYFDDLDYFKIFKNEFPAIVYNDGLTSKLDLEIKPLVSSERIDEFNVNGETSLSEYDKENDSHFNDLFNIIHPDDLKSEKDNDDNDIDIIQTSEGNEITPGANGIFETSHNKIIKTFRTGSFVIDLKVSMVIWNYYVNGVLFFLIIKLYVPFDIPFDPKRYYKDGPLTKITEAKIWHHYQSLIKGTHGSDIRLRSTPRGLDIDLAVRLKMVYSREGHQVFMSHAWRRLFGIQDRVGCYGYAMFSVGRWSILTFTLLISTKELAIRPGIREGKGHRDPEAGVEGAEGGKVTGGQSPGAGGRAMLLGPEVRAGMGESSGSSGAQSNI
ncbi:hypothetical protein Tco_0266385 [Tanacetum coccineum]